MNVDLEHVKELLGYFRQKIQSTEWLDRVEKELDPQGNATYSLAGEFRAVAVYQCVAERKWDEFAILIKRSPQLWMKLLARSHRDETISPSLVDFIPAYQCTLDALAAGDEALAKQVAVEIQHRTEGNGHRWSRIFAHALKSTVLEAEDVEERLVELETEVQQKGSLQFQGHAQVLRCLVERNFACVEEAFQKLIKGHRRLSSGSGMFNLTEDKYLCVWGVGLANLLLLRGLPVEIDDPLIPRQLLLSLGYQGASSHY